jgi:hypothetical protein
VDLTAVFVSMVTAPGNSSAAFAAWLRERGAEEDGLEHQRGADAHENPGVG